MEQQQQREVWIDWMRVVACLMVMVVHSTEPFYLGGEGTRVLSRADALWSGIMDCIVRCCVPLFVIASSFLQFPLHYSTGEFFRRRAVRILVPFAVWSVFYALYWGEPAENFRDLLLNFNYAAGHMWFVYMLVGVYLLMPLLSPWAEKVGKRELQVWIGLWLLTTLIPLVRDWVFGAGAVVYGPSGIPQSAHFPLWGEGSWNAYGTFYYISGFFGYLLLGLYFRRFVGELSWGRTLGLALPLYLGGFAIAFGGYLRRVWATTGGVFPFEGPLDHGVWWETTWCNDTLGVALMAIGLILLFRKISCSGGFYRRVLLPVSQASYGMYLAHMAVLVLFAGWLGGWIGSSLGFWSAPVTILATAVCTFVTVAVGAVLVRRVPVVGRWIVG